MVEAWLTAKRPASAVKHFCAGLPVATLVIVVQVGRRQRSKPVESAVPPGGAGSLLGEQYC
jgi:hypothetical protein